METKPLAEWTVMIYMASDNSLSAECVWALTEMKKAKREAKSRAGKINVIAQFDPSDGLAKTRRYEIDDRPRRLDAAEKDFATLNPATGEVYFRHESPAAHDMARKRLKSRKAFTEMQLGQIKQGEEVNLISTADETGASQNDTDAASPITLYNFLSFGVRYYPAKHYMVVLSGHSAGIQPSYLLRDESSGSYMTFRQLKSVFQQLHQKDLKDKGRKDDERGKVIDILGFDTCLMSMAEICYELRDSGVETVIGSESYTPASGWPYLLILEKLKHKRNTRSLGSSQLAKAIVESYVSYYSDYVAAGVSVALSALNVNEAEGLVSVVKRLTSVLIRELKAEHPELSGKPETKTHPFTDALVLAHWEAQSYNGEWYVDLVDFCECLSKRYPYKGIPAACRGVIRHVREQLVIRSRTCGPEYQYSNGTAIYFPWASVANYFWGFEFASKSKSGWGDFLAHYTNLTRRKFRVPDQPNAPDQKRIKKLETHGGNFLNYVPEFEKINLQRMGSDRNGSDLKESDILIFNRMGSDRMGSDRMTTLGLLDKMGSDRMGSDRMGSDRSGNPIHSMRNPPIVSLDFDF
jgi:hypothetical protein